MSNVEHYHEPDTSPPADPRSAEGRIARLDEPARAILKDLEDSERDFLAIQEGKMAQVNELRRKRDEQVSEMAHYDRQITYGGVKVISEADIARRAKMDSNLAAIRKKTTALQDEISHPKTSYFPTARITEHFKGDRQQYRSRETKIRLPKGQTALKRLAEVRNECTQLLANARATEIAPLTRAEARAAVMPELQQLFTLGEPDVRPAFRMPKDAAGRRRQGRVKLPMQSVPTPDAADGYFPVDRGIAFVAWLLRDQVIAAFDKLLDEHASPDALSKEQRRLTIASLKQEALALEYEEATLVRMARAAGFQAEYRHDISVPALLDIVPVDSDLEDDGWLEGGVTESDDAEAE